MKNKKLLYIVDDDDIYTYTVSKMMEKCIADTNTEIEIYDEGESALEALLSTIQSGITPSIILLDLDMPIMDGWEFLDATEKLDSEEMPIIFISSSTINPDEISRAEDHPLVGGFISKPISKERIQEVCSLLKQ